VVAVALLLLDRYRITQSEPEDDVVVAQPAPAAMMMPAKSVAVLPFVNMSADMENEFFSDVGA
jgi:TolB-like protein